MAIIKAVLTVSLDIMLTYIIVASALVKWPPATSLAFCLKSSILMSNTMWHHTNWLTMGTGFPSGKSLNATLTFPMLVYVIVAGALVIGLLSQTWPFV